ncbi:M23 family metallopeptidase [Aquicoccus porphyridii]|uniref:M23 family metallopeptidase n=1 Tax=Aquicoccus porphyridii TaxID=1852029 RepID=UPI00273FAC64|nr:M23 family metallopeptidase [Aquicoccus porphyridii]
MSRDRHERNLSQPLFLAVVTLAGMCLALPLRGEAPRLAQPIDCTLGEDCYIQNYVDHDPGPGYADFTCGPLSYDGHKGTDFALISRAAMTAGVTVHAAAAGRVTALRDGMTDGVFLEDPAAVKDRECGNGVVIDHGEDWQTQYCHLQKDSVSVTKGQSVKAGAPLGRVGLSGRTEFPHVHVSLRHDGKAVDPFNPDGDHACEEMPRRTLWQDPAPHYRPGGMLSAGFSDAVPAYDHVKSGHAATVHLPADAPALVVWGFAFGGRPGDRVMLEIDAPDGSRIISHTVELENPMGLFFRAAGKRLSGPAWPKGVYHGQVSLQRDGQHLGTRHTTVTIGR